jgi:hypothetical protein
VVRRRAIDWFEGKVGEMPPIYRWFQTGHRQGGLADSSSPDAGQQPRVPDGRVTAACRFPASRRRSSGSWIKLAVLWWGGEAVRGPDPTILDWVQDYQWWLVAGLFLLSFATQGRRAKANLPEVVEELEHPHEFDPVPDGDGFEARPETAGELTGDDDVQP